MGHVELAGHLNGHGAALKILLIGPQYQHEHIGDGDRQQRLLVETRMRVDEEIIKPKMLAQILQAVIEQVDIVAVAQNLGDMVTAKQRGMIRAIAREAKVDADKECAIMMNCSIDELSKRAASDLIERLQEMQRVNAVPMRRVG